MLEIEIELFGIPRRRVGQSRVSLSINDDPCRLSALVDSLAKRYPDLAGETTIVNNRYRDIIVCVDDHLFVRSPDDVVEPQHRILLMSADVGG